MSKVINRYEIMPVIPMLHAVVWPEIANGLQASLDEFPSLITIESLERKVREGQLTAWVVRHGHKIVAGYVTEIMRGSARDAVNVVAMGGSFMDQWVEQVSDSLVEYAVANGCSMVIELGRPGWAKVLRPLGWTDGPLMMIRRV